MKIHWSFYLVFSLSTLFVQANDNARVFRSRILSLIAKDRHLRYFEVRLVDKMSLFETIPDKHWNEEHQTVRPLFIEDNDRTSDKFKHVFGRGAVDMEYLLTYGKFFHRRHADIENGESFLQLLRENLRRPLDDERFSYAILMDEKGHKVFRFAPTGSKKKKRTRGLVTKHVMHAHMAETVKYSGEFRFQCTYDEEGYEGDCTLLIDNDSGSYAPLYANLPLVVKLLKAEINGLKIVINEERCRKN